MVEGDRRAAAVFEEAAALRDCDVVARCLPSIKLELVRALRAAGETVAVTGDGVNDVPALQGADIGIAMGARGTRSAHEVAAIVLLDDNFRTIVRAIGEGRQLFENLRLSFAYLLIVHLPLVSTAAWYPRARTAARAASNKIVPFFMSCFIATDRSCHTHRLQGLIFCPGIRPVLCNRIVSK